jgi:hypothetical protein
MDVVLAWSWPTCSWIILSPLLGQGADLGVCVVVVVLDGLDLVTGMSFRQG